MTQRVASAQNKRKLSEVESDTCLRSGLTRSLCNQDTPSSAKQQSKGNKTTFRSLCWYRPLIFINIY
jgi:hypothetical protein